jgi:hypothetical protein
LGSATITHPYHPLRGQQFRVLKTRRVAGKPTLIVEGTAGGSFAVPLAWTDRGAPSPWSDLKKLPPILYVPHLWSLLELVDSLVQVPHQPREQ